MGYSVGLGATVIKLLPYKTYVHREVFLRLNGARLYSTVRLACLLFTCYRRILARISIDTRGDSR